MKLFLEPIDVQVRDDLPAALEWRGCAYRVEQVLQEWTWRGRWWTDALLRGESRHYYRVTCAATARAAEGRRPPGRGREAAREAVAPPGQAREGARGTEETRTALPSRQGQSPGGERLGYATRAARPVDSPTCLDIYERGGRWMLSRVLD